MGILGQDGSPTSEPIGSKKMWRPDSLSTLPVQFPNCLLEIKSWVDRAEMGKTPGQSYSVSRGSWVMTGTPGFLSSFCL